MGIMAAFISMILSILSIHLAAVEAKTPILERVSTIAPFPRGLAMVDGKLFVLCRGRVRGAGGVSAAIEDQAGTIYKINPNIAEPAENPMVSDAVRLNGEVLTRPTSPPFLLWDRSSLPPERDRHTDRPYCTLRWHEATRSFYLCAFSGIDKKRTPEDPVAFSKNRTDGLLRYDLRTEEWYEVERHDPKAGAAYPHHDPANAPSPHGFLNGPDNCLPLGKWLYAVGKDNSVLVRYDLSSLEKNPEGGPPPGEMVLGDRVQLTDGTDLDFRGHSTLAFHGGWLYVGSRTTSQIIRLALDSDFTPIRPIRAELIARFEPFDARTGSSANITDMCFDHAGWLYVISAQPARVYRFHPNPHAVFNARDEGEQPWADLAALTHNPRMKGENVLWHGGWLYVTSGDGYDYQEGASGTVYRVRAGD